MIKAEPETEPEPPEPESKESKTSQDKTEGGTVCGQYPVHNWGVPITTGAYQLTPSEPLRCASAHGQPVTTGACTTDQLPLQALSEPGVHDGQSSSSRSLKSGEEEMAVEIPAKTSGTLTQMPLESGSGSLQNLTSPRTGSARRRSYKKRSPKQTSVEEEESRKQRRLEKNRQTAAVSRERKRVQFADLQQKVAELEKDNDRLNLELEKRDRQLETAKEELASLTRGASRTVPAQPAFESAELEDALPLAQVLMQWVILPLLICLKTCNLMLTFSHSTTNFRFWLKGVLLATLLLVLGLGTTFLTQLPLAHFITIQTPMTLPDLSLWHRVAASLLHLRRQLDRSPHLDRQFCEQQTSGLERQGWGHILCPQYHHQARLEVDYGGPVLSLGNCETVNSLNYPEKETDQLQERNLSVHSQAGQDLRSQIQSPYTQI